MYNKNLGACVFAV